MEGSAPVTNEELRDKFMEHTAFCERERNDTKRRFRQIKREQKEQNEILRGIQDTLSQGSIARENQHRQNFRMLIGILLAVVGFLAEQIFTKLFTVVPH